MDLASQYIDNLEDGVIEQSVEITALTNILSEDDIVDISCLDENAIDYTDIAWY